jgi:hypothetical protein
MSNATNLRSNLAKMAGLDADRVLVSGKGSWDHDHPIPRKLNIRSRASRRTFGMVNGRLTGVECWPSTGGSYLLSGSFAIVQARDLRPTPTNQLWAISTVRKNETVFDDKTAPPTLCPSDGAWPNFRNPTSLPLRRTHLAPRHISKSATKRRGRERFLECKYVAGWQGQLGHSGANMGRGRQQL